MRTFGFDLGSQLVLNTPSEINWELLAAWDLKPRFALLRAHRGMWEDPAFRPFTSAAERVGLPWGAWHVLSRNVSVSEQVNRWLMAPTGPMGRSVDWEPWADGSVPTGTQLVEAVERIEQRDGRAGLIYSRYMLIDRYLNAVSTEWLSKRFYWLAQYLTLQQVRGEHPGPPTLPKRVSTEQVILHQTADKLAGPKGAIPHASALDRDRWVGQTSLEDWLAQGPGPVLSLEERVKRLEAQAHSHG